MKFEMLPPGQDATRIIPKAIIGLIQPSKVIVRRNVSAGKRMIWQIMPNISDLGFCRIPRKDLGLMPKATPNMTKASTILMAFMPASFIFTFMASRFAITSGLINFSF
jgi:hypothetical protein